MFYVIAGHELLKLIGTVGRTIVTHQLVGDPMCGEVFLQEVDQLPCQFCPSVGQFQSSWNSNLLYRGSLCHQSGGYHIQQFPTGDLESCER